ncbi:MAG: hypothetical protein ACRCT8_05755 [Lacipirellulaceae bacterium]
MSLRRLLVYVLLSLPVAADAEAAAAGAPLELAGGKLVVTPPAAWKVVPPANNMLEAELSAPAPDGSDVDPARMTVMTAGGSIDANVQRWIAQFRATEGGADPSKAKIDKLDAGGMQATIVDLSGEYMDSMGGPFGPKTPRPNYRLVGAIVATGDAGNYFFKLIGPEETVAEHADSFRAMIQGAEMK